MAAETEEPQARQGAAAAHPARYVTLHPRRLLAFARGGAYDRSGGNGSRTGGGRILSRSAVRVRMRGENGYRSPSMTRSSSASSAADSSADKILRKTAALPNCVKLPFRAQRS
jgi:hypothetical protein